MLVIQCELEKDQIIPYCKQCKKVYHPGMYLYRGMDKETELATGLFEIQENKAEIISYQTSQPEDTALFDGILRAGFHYAGEQGLENGIISIDFRETFDSYFRELNYPLEPEFQIQNFFSKYKNCQHIQ